MTHWRDEKCKECGVELPTPTFRGQPYVCCNGIDCGCQGFVLPVGFCSVACFEHYEESPVSESERT